MDSVTLAMAVETAFRMEVEPVPINTVGDLHRYVCEKVCNRPAQCLSLQAFQALRRVLVRAGMARAKVRLDTRVRLRQLDWFVVEWELGARVSRPSRGWRDREEWSLGDLVVALRTQLPGQDRLWTEERVWRRLVEIVSEVFDVPAEIVRPESDFVLDLGAC
ncbi:MAG: hypothetical protein KF760_30815 [Candidatus Eremiobacteraeota bacterium]|nr:hypothetical protein [Candidatus Eremiobacteraeota bacterium]MCW5871233.1 hypothetical protein [Candidatus Eremiobacteraeota bacterium]